MRSKALEPNLLEVDLTAMIDVIFILLLFWLTVARLQDNRDQRVETPRAGESVSAAQPRKLLTVNLVSDAPQLSVDGRQISTDELLQELAGGPLPQHVLIRAPADIDCQAVSRLTGALRGAGIRRIGLAVRREGP